MFVVVVVDRGVRVMFLSYYDAPGKPEKFRITKRTARRVILSAPSTPAPASSSLAALAALSTPSKQAFGFEFRIELEWNASQESAAEHAKNDAFLISYQFQPLEGGHTATATAAEKKNVTVKVTTPLPVLVQKKVMRMLL